MQARSLGWVQGQDPRSHLRLCTSLSTSSFLHLPKPSIKGPRFSQYIHLLLPEETHKLPSKRSCSPITVLGANNMQSEICRVIAAVGDPVHWPGIINRTHNQGRKESEGTWGTTDNGSLGLFLMKIKRAGITGNCFLLQREINCF